MAGKHVELFLVDGVAGGITTAEIVNWTGHILSAPRSELAAVLQREEVSRNGAYLLLGDDPESIGGVRCYIGRSENLGQRLRRHHESKDFWERVILISAKDRAYGEGHWGYLEARLVELAKTAGRVSLENSNEPQGRKLSEAQISDMEEFITQLKVILPVLGVNAIRVRKVVETPAEEQSESPIFTLKNPKIGVEAKAQVVADEFTMLAGSLVVATWRGISKTESTKRSYEMLSALQRKLINDGSIEVTGKQGKLVRDIAFSSPSQAAAIALGRSSNGRTEWKWETGTYADWEQRGLT